MEHQFSRSQLLFGAQAMKRLSQSRVAVFGIGGVGGYVVEALARGGIGAFDLIDSDTVSLSNLNRQIIATHSTIGQYKTDVAKARILDINPQALVYTHHIFYTPQTSNQLDFTQYDYVVDAIDTVSGKLELVMQANRAGVPIISSMGAGNKIDPTAFEVSDIYKTSVCPLARVMRRELKQRGIQRLKVVYSKEPAIAFAEGEIPCGSLAKTPGSNSFVPPTAGLILAGEVIKDLCQITSGTLRKRQSKP